MINYSGARTRWSVVGRVGAVILGLTIGGAQASLGPFEHGSGIRSMGFGGVSYVSSGETNTLAVNPAQAGQLGNRYDIGIDVLHFSPKAKITGNALGPDTSSSSSWGYFYIPQGGMATRLNDRWSAGFSLLMAGVGTDYPTRMYARFGATERVGVGLRSASLATAVSYKLTPRQSVGAGLLLGYQSLKVEGFTFLDSPQVSSEPGKVTDRGQDGTVSLGFSLGWSGQLTSRLTAGIGYRSKAWTQRESRYAGLVPNKGRLEIPSVYGAALAYRVIPTVKTAVEVQHYAYEQQIAFRNSLSQLSQGHQLGSSDGPGFGVQNQTAYKFGVEWDASPVLALRAGYVRANQMIQPSDTLLTAFVPICLTTNYTTGATWQFRQWEISGMAAFAPRQTVHGQGSIPASFGGGEATMSNQNWSFGVSFGHHF